MEEKKHSCFVYILHIKEEKKWFKREKKMMMKMKKHVSCIIYKK